MPTKRPPSISYLCAIMSEQVTYKGTVSFIHPEKNFGTLEYLQGAKPKSVNFKTNEAEAGKKPHRFRLGDTVSFQLRLSDRGDKMTACNVRFVHNTAIDLLLQQAAIENRFSGYLKMVDDQYFVKEINSYILFPLKLSPWEKAPVPTAVNEAISFSLVNIDKPQRLEAGLFSHNYIPAYKKALQHFKNGIDTEATVYKVTAHGIYVHLFDEAMQAKLPVAEGEAPAMETGTRFPVLITHLSPFKIVIRRADETHG